MRRKVEPMERRLRPSWAMVTRSIIGVLVAFLLTLAGIVAFKQDPPPGGNDPVAPLPPVSTPLGPKWLDPQPQPN